MLRAEKQNMNTEESSPKTELLEQLNYNCIMSTRTHDLITFFFLINSVRSAQKISVTHNAQVCFHLNKNSNKIRVISSYR